MRKTPPFFILALIIAILSLVGCGGGDWEEEINPPTETAQTAEKAYHEATTSVFREGSGTAPGLEWSRDVSVPVDHLIVRFGERVIYDEYHWWVYGNRGQTRGGDDIVLVHAYEGPDDSGRATLFIGGRYVPLPDIRVDRNGANHSAALRNVRELADGWLLGFATYKPQATEAEPINRAWVLIHIPSGRVIDLGEYCGRCSRR